MRQAKILLIALLLFGAETLWAQNRPTERDADLQNRRVQRTEQIKQRIPLEQLARRIKQLQMWKLTERLNLSEEQSMKFFPRYNRYQDDLTDALQNLQMRLSRLQELYQTNGKESDLDEEIKAVVAERKNVSDVLPKYLNEFRQVLTAQQTAGLILFERDFLRDITDAIERARARKRNQP
ncbi:MAG: hypothetical protein ACUVRP_08975 [Chlorobiales bacterium]